jgi:PBP1b-binding outer membrane lipoprotein LpoB
MKIAKALVASIALATLGLAGCGGGVEGTYKLDKAEMKKSMEAEVAKLPADQQGFAKLAVALIDTMDMSMELQSGGKLKMKATMPSLDKDKPAKTDEKDGTWKVDGDSVMIDAGDGKGAIKCAKGGGKLTCEPGKKGDPVLVFVKG